jgi:NAD(P)-dependent dehydrogenase (short-subunit alcohol dehydrogenase family)
MNSLPSNFKAIVFGASGAIGGAFSEALTATPNCDEVISISRQTHPDFDIGREETIADVARELAPLAPFHLMVDATGALHLDGIGPEKRLQDIEGDMLMRAFLVNAIGPALLLKHFVPLLPLEGRCIVAKLSARVGSIADNRKGGWYGYRASKAALNMLLQTTAIEVNRRRPDGLLVALQPGTVHSRLTAPFLSSDSETSAMSPPESVDLMLRAIDQLPASRRATFIDYRGEPVAW